MLIIRCCNIIGEKFLEGGSFDIKCEDIFVYGDCEFGKWL